MVTEPGKTYAMFWILCLLQLLYYIILVIDYI